MLHTISLRMTCLSVSGTSWRGCFGSASGMPQIEHRRSGERCREAGAPVALDGQLARLLRLAAVDAVPVDRVGAGRQRHREFSRVARVEYEVLMTWIRQRIPGRAEI